jgi:hypothetical protein
MRREKWNDVVGLIKDKFEVFDDRIDKEEIGEDINGDSAFKKREILEFEGPLGKMKIELIIRPIVVEKKTNFSRRIGSDTAVTYIYSDKEETTKFQVYKWDEDDEIWTEVEESMFA